MSCKFSICIPAYNAENVIVDTLRSVLNVKMLDDVEIIIVDDGSTDNTKMIATDFLNNSGARFKIIESDNYGRSFARNKAAENSSGNYLIFLDADDILNSDYIIELSKKTEMNDCVVSQVEYVDKNLNTLYFQNNYDNEISLYDNLVMGNLPYTSAICIRREIFEVLGGFRVELEEREDWDLFCRLVFLTYTKDEVSITCLERSYVKFRIHDANNSANHQRFLHYTKVVISDLINVLSSANSISNEEKKRLKFFVYLGSIRHFSSRPSTLSGKIYALNRIFSLFRIHFFWAFIRSPFLLKNIIKLVVVNYENK